ncbi:hypothetical protein ACWCOP_06090 [Maricaulaceae bacterium MS644]
MHPATKAASLVLAIVGLLNWSYAGYQTVQGEAVSDSLPLIIGGLVCFTMIVILNAATRRKKD